MQPLTPTSIADLLSRHELRASRALGQCFLADPNTARRIVRLAAFDRGAPILEIGPGIGSLTIALLEAGANVTALELDRHVLPALREVVGDVPEVVHGDALTADLDQLVPAANGPWMTVSNLPYNVATPIVMRLLEEAPQIRTMLVMVQREVGERFAATPGGKAFGAVTVKISYFARATVVGMVPPTVFFPHPKVDSALVRIDRYDTPAVDVDSRADLFALIKAGFATRRKMLRSALRPLLGVRTVEILTAAGVNPTTRAEALEIAEWAMIARAVK